MLLVAGGGAGAGGCHAAQVQRSRSFPAGRAAHGRGGFGEAAGGGRGHCGLDGLRAGLGARLLLELLSKVWRRGAEDAGHRGHGGGEDVLGVVLEHGHPGLGGGATEHRGGGGGGGGGDRATARWLLTEGQGCWCSLFRGHLRVNANRRLFWQIQFNIILFVIDRIINGIVS